MPRGVGNDRRGPFCNIVGALTADWPAKRRPKWLESEQRTQAVTVLAGMWTACARASNPVGFMQHELYVALFSATVGFTASGIVANLYRLIVKKEAVSGLARMAYLTIMVVAGPTVLFDNAARAWRAKTCSGLSFCVAAAIAAYWSLAVGLLLVQLGMAVR